MLMKLKIAIIMIMIITVKIIKSNGNREKKGKRAIMYYCSTVTSKISNIIFTKWFYIRVAEQITDSSKSWSITAWNKK